MKYMTKEWYETSKKTSFYLPLKVSEKAEVFSEDYFKKLYKSEEKTWLKMQERFSKLTFEDLYPNEFVAEDDDGCPFEAEEYEKAKREYFEMREQARLEFVEHPPFEPEKEKKVFQQELFYNVIKDLKENLPDEILQKVADIRVLALNRASADIKKEIKKYCKANDKAAQSASSAYWKDYEKRFKKEEPSFSEFSFHDSKVVSCRKKGKDMVITLDRSHGFTDITQIIFKNCMVIKQDKPLHGAWWLYDEIYRTNDGYEIHALLTKNELIDFIVTVTDTEFK